MPAHQLAERVRAVIGIARPAGAAVIVNDRADIALACGADGVHVGQGDLAVADVRRIAGTSLLVGVSTHSLAEARAALAAGADVCGVGAMFPTGLKPSIVPGGPAYLREYLSACGRVPHLAIGGITPANVGELSAAGCQGVAVSSVVCAARDPASVVRALVAGLGAAPSGAAAPPLSAGRA
jgi:thiamine-phosphate pyrophosphorylase